MEAAKKQGAHARAGTLCCGSAPGKGCIGQRIEMRSKNARCWCSEQSHQERLHGQSERPEDLPT